MPPTDPEVAELISEVDEWSPDVARLIRWLRETDPRHAFAVASLVDDPDSIYRLSEHPGHTLVSTTEIYTGHLRRDGAMWRYSRDRELFGPLATPAIPARIEAA